MKKMNRRSVETRVSRFLARYRITPQTSTGVSTAELLLGRKPRSRKLEGKYVKVRLLRNCGHMTGTLKNVPCGKEKQFMQAISEVDPSGCLEF